MHIRIPVEGKYTQHAHFLVNENVEYRHVYSKPLKVINIYRIQLMFTWNTPDKCDKKHQSDVLQTCLGLDVCLNFGPVLAAALLVRCFLAFNANW